MKKTIQINLGGISFNVEEQAFSILSQYLDAIKKHFSSYEGHEEIVSDIESRIAEKFYEKSKVNEVIELEDVNKVIKSMGSVSDFEALKEDGDLSSETNNENGDTAKESFSDNEPRTETPKSKFYRDGKRRALGGVLAGLAHRYDIDVVWLRIFFIVFAFGFLESGVGGFFFLAYIVCWISFVEKNDLEENKAIKKFYRDPSNKVLGGVATGLSTYLGLELAIVRVIFVISGFFGIGILIYLIFWVVAPSAISLTQKMELSGQKLTIQNIESSIKTNTLKSVEKSESAISKILLFPFRIIGVILKALGHILVPVGNIIKVFAGIILLILGASLAFASLVATGVFYGVLSDVSWIQGTDFFAMFSEDFPPISGLFGFFVTFIPAIAILFLGLYFITKTKLTNRSFWISALALWFGGVVGLSAIASRFAMNFNKSYKTEQTQEFSDVSKILLLDIVDNEEFDNQNSNSFFETDIEIAPSENGNIYVVKEFRAKGSSKGVAQKYSENISYGIIQKDSVLYFERNLKLNGKQKFRNQKVKATLFLPKNKTFKISNDFSNKIWHQSYEIREEYGISRNNIEKFSFKINNEGDIICIDCPRLSDEEKEAMNRSHSESGDFTGEFDNHYNLKKEFNVKNFDKIEFGNSFIATIKYGTVSKVEAFSDNQENLDDLDIDVSGGDLDISYQDSFKNRNSKVELIITTNNLTGLNISGAATVKVIGFSSQKRLNIDLSGASKVGVDTDVEDLEIDISGASILKLKGRANAMSIDLGGASQLLAEDLKVNKVKVDASGASRASFGKVNDISKSVSGGSEVSVK